MVCKQIPYKAPPSTSSPASRVYFPDRSWILLEDVCMCLVTIKYLRGVTIHCRIIWAIKPHIALSLRSWPPYTAYLSAVQRDQESDGTKQVHPRYMHVTASVMQHSNQHSSKHNMVNVHILRCCIHAASLRESDDISLWTRICALSRNGVLLSRSY